MLEFGVSEKPVDGPGQAWRWVLLLIYLLALVGLALMWRDPEMRHWLEPQEISRMGRQLLDTPLGPLAVLAAYVLVVMMGAPTGLLITGGVFIFGPWPGMAYALVGMMAGAIVTYGIGRFTGAQTVDRWTSGRLALLSQHLRQRGLLAVFIARAMPVAPFIMVNLMSGALRVRFREYVAGTFLGLLPGVILISLFLDRLAAAWRKPDAASYIALAACVLGLGLAFWWLRRRLRKAT